MPAHFFSAVDDILLLIQGALSIYNLSVKFQVLKLTWGSSATWVLIRLPRSQKMWLHFSRLTSQCSSCISCWGGSVSQGLVCFWHTARCHPWRGSDWWPVWKWYLYFWLRGFSPKQNRSGDRDLGMPHWILTCAVGIELASRGVFHIPIEFLIKALSTFI